MPYQIYLHWEQECFHIIHLELDLLYFLDFVNNLVNGYDVIFSLLIGHLEDCGFQREGCNHLFGGV